MSGSASKAPGFAGGYLLIREIPGSIDSYADLPLADAKKAIREIARRPGIRFPTTMLYNALVSTTILNRLEGEGVPVRENLSPVHVRSLVNLSLDEQLGLARRAILHTWKTGRLQQEARRARRKYKGKTQTPRYEKALRRVERWGRANVFDDETLDTLSTDDLVLDELDGLIARVSLVEHRLGQQLSRLRRRAATLGGKLRKLPRSRRPRRKKEQGLSYAEIIREVGAASTSAA